MVATYTKLHNTKERNNYAYRRKPCSKHHHCPTKLKKHSIHFHFFHFIISTLTFSFQNKLEILPFASRRGNTSVALLHQIKVWSISLKSHLIYQYGHELIHIFRTMLQFSACIELKDFAFNLNPAATWSLADTPLPH